MTIYLIYIIKAIVLPLSSLLLVAFLGWYFVFIRHIQWGKYLLLFVLWALWLFSLPVFALWLAQIWETYPVLNLAELERHKPGAIVVIGGGLTDQATEFNAEKTLNFRTLQRVRYAAFLAKQIHLPLLVSGGRVFESASVAEADVMAKTLTEEFLTPVQWIENQSRNTAENARYSYRLLQAENIQRIVLITHGLHMVRAVSQFEQVGFHVLAAPTASLAKTNKFDGFLQYWPSVQSLEISSMVIHEALGLLWYRFRYRN